MIATDIALDDNNDMLIRNGDIAIEPSDAQHMDHMLLSKPTDWKQWPLIGIDIAAEINGEWSATDINRIRQRIQRNADMDNMKVNKMDLRNMNDFKVDVSR